MLVLLALGAMNLLVMLAMAAVIALEKLLAKPQPIVHLTGIVAMIAGIFKMARSLL